MNQAVAAAKVDRLLALDNYKKFPTSFNRRRMEDTQAAWKKALKANVIQGGKK